jgi:GNAT superfamily N-acetyltransferase
MADGVRSRKLSHIGLNWVLPTTIDFRGISSVLRRLEPADASNLIQFFQSHTVETIHQRYGYVFGQMTPDHAARLVGVDQSRDCALGVFESGRAEVLIAIGRYCLAATGVSAELAFVVREDRRRRGIATALYRALLAVSQKRGLIQLTAQVGSENFPMLSVFRNSGASVTTIPNSGVSTITINLSRSETHATVEL